MVPGAHRGLLTSLLREVSRSFYLTLRVLPGAIRPQISLAYLLARTADTLADTVLAPVGERLDALEALRARIQDQSGGPLDLTRFADAGAGQPGGVSEAERMLLRRVEEALSLLTGFAERDQRFLREVLDTITSGQALDLRRFGAVPAGQVVALQSDGELDDYTYRVAGCVGGFWTRLCRAHLFPDAALDEHWLLAQGVRFGKGLQLVNVLRDLPADLRSGRCYLPEPALRALGLAPADLLDPRAEPRLRPLYHHWLGAAEAHLCAGWDYTQALPRGQWRVRLACAWPVLIGARTLERLRAGRVLDPAARIKVSRAEVRGIVVRSALASPFPGAFRRLWPGAPRGFLQAGAASRVRREA